MAPKRRNPRPTRCRPNHQRRSRAALDSRAPRRHTLDSAERDTQAERPRARLARGSLARLSGRVSDAY
jgi:hypothetical protein